MKPYETYSFAEFLDDEYFLTTAARPTPESERFWADWLAQHPDRRAAFRSICLLTISELG